MFYVMLPSNVYSPDGRENFVNDYTTGLKDPIDLTDDEYEVALSEISFSNKRNTLHTEQEATISFKETNSFMKSNEIMSMKLSIDLKGNVIFPTTDLSMFDEYSYMMTNVDIDQTITMIIFQTLTQNRRNLLDFKSDKFRAVFSVDKIPQIRMKSHGNYSRKDLKQHQQEYIKTKPLNLKTVTLYYSKNIKIFDLFNKHSMENKQVRIGLYSTVDDLVTEINNVMTGLITVKYDKIRNLCFIVKQKENIEVKFSDVIKSMLFSGSVSLDRGIFHCYIYTDIIENTVIGNVSAPILRIIPISNHEEIVRATFNNPYFIKVNRKTISMIRITLNDDSGGLLPISNGKSCAVLVFRKIQQ